MRHAWVILVFASPTWATDPAIDTVLQGLSNARQMYRNFAVDSTVETVTHRISPGLPPMTPKTTKARYTFTADALGRYRFEGEGELIRLTNTLSTVRVRSAGAFDGTTFRTMDAAADPKAGYSAGRVTAAYSNSLVIDPRDYLVCYRGDPVETALRATPSAQVEGVDAVEVP